MEVASLLGVQVSHFGGCHPTPPAAARGQKRISIRHYFVFCPRAAAGRAGVGLGAGVGKGKKEFVSGVRAEVGAGETRYHGHFGSKYMLCLNKNATKNFSLP